MTYSKASWQIDLDNKPNIAAAGIGTHGNVPVARYHLDGLWCFHLYHHPADLSIDGRPFVVRPRDVGITPPSVDIEYRFHATTWVAAFAHFAMPSAAGGAIAIPALQNLGDDFELFYERFKEVLAYSTTKKRRAEIKFWDLLWDLVERMPIAHANAPSIPPAVQKAVDVIEVRLNEQINANDIASQAGVSYTHLARLFQQNLQTSVARHIRNRRVERAKHLLRNSTIPIKEIAALIGIPDLHAFNKTIRRDLGASPTQVRLAQTERTKPCRANKEETVAHWESRSIPKGG